MYFDAPASSSNGMEDVIRSPADTSGWSVTNRLPIEASVGVSSRIESSWIKMNAKISSFQETAPDVLAHITSLIPMRRVGRADEVAALIAWLCSDEVSFSTVAVYDISGGRATY